MLFTVQDTNLCKILNIFRLLSGSILIICLSELTVKSLKLIISIPVSVKVAYLNAANNVICSPLCSATNFVCLLFDSGQVAFNICVSAPSY